MMKRFLLLILSLTFCSLSFAQFANGYSDLDDSETVSALKSHVSYLSSISLDGRAPGSDGEYDAALYVTQTLKDYGVDVLSSSEGDIFGLKQADSTTIESRNVVAFIPGSGKDLKDHYIVIGARMDNLGSRTMTVNGEERKVVFRGANGNASGLAMLLELAAKLSGNGNFLGRSVILIAFGSSTMSYAGSWYFLNRAFTDVGNIDAMIDLDVLGNGNAGFYAYTASNADVNAMIEAVNSTLQPVKPQIVAQAPFGSDNMAFYDKEIPSVLFTTGNSIELGTERDTEEKIEYDMMERELEYIYNFAVSMSKGPKPYFNPTDAGKKRGDSADKVVPYYDCTRKPSFLGNTDPKFFLEKWVYPYLKYPQYAVENGIQGKVLVDFVIDEKGNITDVQVLKGVHPTLDEEAVRIISASPKWKAGMVQGKPVKAEISLYIEFVLQKKKTKNR